MTLHELTLEVMDRLNLSSAEAAARIVRELNTRYKRALPTISYYCCCSKWHYKLLTRLTLNWRINCSNFHNTVANQSGL